MFSCLYCGRSVSTTDILGTLNRNHCPYCLWSKHVDEDVGDRNSQCSSAMKPIGLTFKKEGLTKQGRVKQGEIMLIHMCQKDGKVSINRIAGDDDEKAILEVFDESLKLDQNIRNTLNKQGIRELSNGDRKEITKQLFGVISSTY